MSTDKKAMKILARSFFNQLRTSGYSRNQIIEMSAELLDLVSSDFRGDRDAHAALTSANEAGLATGALAVES